MSNHVNTLGQPIGFPLPNWRPCQKPSTTTMVGHYCRIEQLCSAKHGEDLWQAFSVDKEGRIWTYLPYGPFTEKAQLLKWIDSHKKSADPVFYAIIETTSNQALGIASYLRIQPEVGVVEVGHINYSPALQQTTAATEAMYLMMKHVFELGYRRYEWKCDNQNQGSKKASKRLGFSYDGLFKQASMYKNRNRDTAWFSILDKDWPTLKAEYQRWLALDNFDTDQKQLRKLSIKPV